MDLCICPKQRGLIKDKYLTLHRKHKPKIHLLPGKPFFCSWLFKQYTDTFWSYFHFKWKVKSDCYYCHLVSVGLLGTLWSFKSFYEIHAGIEVMCSYGQVVVSIRKVWAWCIAAPSENHCEAESDAKPNWGPKRRRRSYYRPLYNTFSWNCDASWSSRC